MILGDDPDGACQSLAGYVIGQIITQQFIGRHTDGVHIRGGIQIMDVSTALLRRHVLEGSYDVMCTGRHGGRGIGIRASCHTEVDDLHAAIASHKNVARLEIPMDHTLGVTVPHGFAGLQDQLQSLPGIEFSILCVIRQYLGTGDVFHREVGNTTGTFIPGTCFVDLGDSGMMKPCQHLRFEVEALERTRIRHTRVDHLDSDRSPRMVLTCHVDGAHAAGSDHALDQKTGNSNRHPGWVIG